MKCPLRRRLPNPSHCFAGSHNMARSCFRGSVPHKQQMFVQLKSTQSLAVTEPHGRVPVWSSQLPGTLPPSTFSQVAKDRAQGSLLPSRLHSFMPCYLLFMHFALFSSLQKAHYHKTNIFQSPAPKPSLPPLARWQGPAQSRAPPRAAHTQGPARNILF